MKTPFSRTRRRAGLLSPGGGIAIIAVLAVVIILFVLRIFFPGAVTGLARPLWSIGGTLTGASGGASAFFGDKGEIARERDAYAREVVALRAENAALFARAEDFERLLGGREESQPGTLAGVLVRPPVSPYDTLVLDQGTRDGVAIGQQVQGPGGLPLGTIESVASDTSRALLYSAPGRLVQGWVGEGRTPVSLEGASAGAFRTSVPRESLVAVGEAVYIPGPGAVPIGTVVRVDVDPSTPRAVIHVRPFANPFSLTFVTVSP